MKRIVLFLIACLLIPYLAHGVSETKDGVRQDAAHGDQVLSNALTTTFLAADTALSNAVTTTYVAADTALSNAVTTTYVAADTALSNAVTTTYIAADTALSNAYVAADTALSNAVTTTYVAADTALSNAVTTTYVAADTALSNAYVAADTALSNAVTTTYVAADTALSNALTTTYVAADTALSNAVITTLSNAYVAADTALSNAVTTTYVAADTTLSNAYVAADTALSNAVTTTYVAADTALSNALTTTYIAADTALSNALTTTYAEVAFTDENNTFSETNDFTNGVVLVRDAVLGSEPATKDQLDVASVGDEAWFLYAFASPYVSGFMGASNIPSAGGIQTNSFTDVTDDLNITNWAIWPNLETINGGTWSLDIHYENPSPSGDKDVAPYYIIGFTNGATTNVATSETGPIATASGVHRLLHITLAEDAINNWPGTSGVIMVQLYVDVTGSGNAPEIDFTMEGNTATRLTFSAPGGNYISKGDIDITVPSVAASEDFTSITNSPIRGYIRGMYISYSNTTQIVVQAGAVFCNGNYYQLTQDVTHTVSSLAAGEDYHYIYVDDSQSTGSVVTIIDMTNEPSWNELLIGDYFGNDRKIASLYSKDASATLFPFVTSKNRIDWAVAFNEIAIQANNGAPDGTWQATATAASSKLPVGAIAALFRISNADGGGDVKCSLTTAEAVDRGMSINEGSMVVRIAGTTLWYIDWMDLGPSRNVKFRGYDDDDDTFGVLLQGYEYRR